MYRTSIVDQARHAEPGFVDDMVRQFADAFAFLRELVQNSIDAGATRIRVTLLRTPEGRVTTAVHDDGSGMSRATLEGPLLTLFSSSKDGDDTKIGKYGIGFVSVLACEPLHVEVDTAKGGEAHRLRLFGDHSYELELGERATAGTSVTLVHTMDDAEYARHVSRCTAALARFCRHARVPIELATEDHTVAVNTPFEVEAAVSVVHEEGDVRIAIGAPGNSIGFYNRGLTLFESDDTEPTLAGLAVKIDSPELAHTLSRDTVRRDRGHRDAIKSALRVARTLLREKLLDELDEPADLERTLALLEAAANPVLRIGDAAVVPLAHPFERRTTMTLAKLGEHWPRGVLTPTPGSMVARILALTHPVVRSPELAPILQRHELLASSAVDELEAAEAVDESPADTALLAATFDLLQAVQHPARRVLLAVFSTARDRLCRQYDTDARAVVFHPAAAREIGDATLFFDVSHGSVQNARTAAARGHAVAAARLLVRLVLLEQGALAPAAVDTLLAEARS